LTPLQPARAASADEIAADGAPLAPPAAVPWPTGLRYPATIARDRPEGGVMTSLRRILDTLAAFAIAFACTVVSATNLTIGLGTDVTALDPHYHNVTPNNNVGAHIFGYLVMRNEKSQLVPGLATEWKTIDPTTWEFKLRRGVRFHDGSDFTAADVVASIERVPTVPNSPSPFTAYSKQIREVIVVDPWTIRFRTATPYPLMPSDMTQILIISRAAAKATTDFLFGATKNLKVEAYDPEGAKKLLAEAGYPDGFGITIHAPNNRYVNDARIAQAVAQMLTRVGIDTKVDALTEDALQAVDDVKREAYLQRATELAIGDTGVVPLHFQVNLWAARDGITYVPRTDENTLAWLFRPAARK
jgi:ABC-type transport system substrate-binding protein